MVDRSLVLALDLRFSTPGELRRVEHGVLDNRHLEVALCSRWNAILADDLAKLGLGLAGLGDPPATVLCEGARPTI